MRIGFSHYKPEKTSSSTVVLPLPSPPLLFLFSSSPQLFHFHLSRSFLPFFHPLIAIASAVAWLRASCSSQLQLHISDEKGKKKSKGKERKGKRRKEEKRKGKKREETGGTEELGAQVRSKEWKGDWGRREDDRKTRRKFESDSFRPVKPITVFAGLITRNRVNCKLTRLVLPTKRGETTFENLKRQLDRLSRRSTDVPLEIR